MGAFGGQTGGLVRAASDIELGLYNANDGMYTARLRIGEAEDTGGFGFLFIGNSLFESQGVTSYVANGTIYLTTKNLQGTDLQCGYAPDLLHIPVRSGNTVAADGNWGGLNRYDVDGSGLGANDPYNMIFAFAGTGTNLNSTGSGDSINRKQTLVTGGTTQRIGYLVSEGITRVDAILGPGGTTVRWDIQEGGTTHVTTGTGTINNGAGTNTSAYAAGTRLNLSSALDANAQYWVQLAAPTAGNLNCDGIILSNSNKGIQMLNGCRVGASLWDTYNAATKAAMITTPTSRTGAPCTNMRVCVMNYITNECNVQRDIDAFQTNYQTRITDVLAAGMSCVLEIPCPYDETVHGLAIPWSAYVQRIYRLADANGCMVLDYWKMTGRPTTHTLYETTLGWTNTTYGRHLTDKSAKWQAIQRAAALYRALRG